MEVIGKEVIGKVNNGAYKTEGYGLLAVPITIDYYDQERQVMAHYTDWDQEKIQVPEYVIISHIKGNKFWVTDILTANNTIQNFDTIKVWKLL